jgi:hypothetical protein
MSSKFQRIGWSEFSLGERSAAMSKSISGLSKREGRSITTFTPQSESGGKLRVGIANPYLEHKKFFDDVLSGVRKNATIVNYGTILRHQLNIEFSNRTAFSTPSKNSIISDCGQYFYREVFTKLFNPIIRGYKITEKLSRNSTYSFYSYAKWLYAFINQRYIKKDREQLLAILKEALGNLHDFFARESNVSTTSLSIKSKYDSPSGSTSGESAVTSLLTTGTRTPESPHHET